MYFTWETLDAQWHLLILTNLAQILGEFFSVMISIEAAASSALKNNTGTNLDRLNIIQRIFIGKIQESPRFVI